MLVKLTVEYRRAGETWPAGTHLELNNDEAAHLIEDGDAVPVRRKRLSREYR